MGRENEGARHFSPRSMTSSCGIWDFRRQIDGAKSTSRFGSRDGAVSFALQRSHAARPQTVNAISVRTRSQRGAGQVDDARSLAGNQAAQLGERRLQCRYLDAQRADRSFEIGLCLLPIVIEHLADLFAGREMKSRRLMGFTPRARITDRV